MIEIRNLKKVYGEFEAVKDLSLTIKEGEVFGLLGPNGAGKSTTVSMLSTVINPTSGEIKIAGKPLKGNEKEIKSLIGIVPQEIALYETMSAKNNLQFFGTLYGLKGKKLKERVDEILEIIELKDKANQAVGKYSGGMKRRVNIGVAMMHDPKIIIFDEPTVGIDPQSRNHILETIKRLNEEHGTTVIYTSHYMEEVDYLCSRVGIIDHGELIACGTKEELKQKVDACDVLKIIYKDTSASILKQIEKIDGVKKIVLDEDENSVKMFISSQKKNIMDIVDDLKKIGVNITGFSFEEVNLETMFLQLTGKTLRE